MDRIQILVVGNHQDEMFAHNVFQEKHPKWQFGFTTDDEESILLFQQVPYDVVLFVKAPPETVLRLQSVFQFQHPEIILLQYDSLSLLAIEQDILFALDRRKVKVKFNFRDGLLN